MKPSGQVVSSAGSTRGAQWRCVQAQPPNGKIPGGEEGGKKHYNHHVSSSSPACLGSILYTLLRKMDPLSLTALTAGLITLADHVVIKGSKIYSSIRWAPTEIATLLGETSTLKNVLSELERTVQE